MMSFINIAVNIYPQFHLVLGVVEEHLA